MIVDAFEIASLGYSEFVCGLGFLYVSGTLTDLTGSRRRETQEHIRSIS
jgi:hypothetical protein